MTRVVVIDNDDSFTANVSHALHAAGAGEVVVLSRRDPLAAVAQRAATHVVLGPGPGDPRVLSGLSREVARRYLGVVPMLGICLGHQILALELGARTRVLDRPTHGVVSTVRVHAPGVLGPAGSQLSVMRYHSHVVVPESLPPAATVTSRAEDDGAVMSFEDPGRVLVGVQFHPESIGTPDGVHVLARFLTTTRGASR
ncbi:anthranilate synthase component II [Cellulosimicrobium protaetiae]|uniref:Aminodeoxychorismate/anthranilate synthase component II n=1 Tax=Cellulosimicrobium protaetiae TaxID=2587808 RepID=A0A6M5UCN5_9MICO|nr:aminodeoxychorismate/anthranilate synthase component II [Cellulosimicrobium protaetiae]QJW34848.1 aminodeoxychorismate/anthranilate synthase component II [Cellulosimicrobium protaetiae]